MDIMTKVKWHATISAILFLIPIILGVFLHPAIFLLAPIILILCYWHFHLTIVNKIK